MDTSHTQFESISCDEELTQQIRITDLIKAFLEQICMYLDFPSIVRAADVCTQFREATKRPFKQKYAKNVVKLAITPKSSELYHVKDNHVTITDLKIGMNTLRCFGDTITQLEVVNPNLRDYNDAYLKYRSRQFVGAIPGFKHLFNKDEPPPDDTFKLHWERRIRDVLLYVNEYCDESLIKFTIDPPIGIGEL